MKPDILEDLLHHEIRSLYSAEKQLAHALKKLARAACQPKLQAEFKTRLSESCEQMKRLEHMAGFMETSLHASRCKGMEQLVEEAMSLLHESAAGVELDAAVIAAVQHLGGYEVESYTMAITLLSRLGFDDMEVMLQKSLREKKTAETRLARLGKSRLTGSAVSAGEAVRRRNLTAAAMQAA